MIDTSKMSNQCPHCEGTGEIEHDIGSRLAWLRKQSGKTQETAAKAIGVSRPAFVNMEQGRQNITQQNLKSICRYFEVSADWLLGL